MDFDDETGTDDKVLLVGRNGRGPLATSVRPRRQKQTPSAAATSSRWSRVCGLYAGAAFAALACGLSLAMPGPTLLAVEHATKSREDQVVLLFAGRAVGGLGGALLSRFLSEFVSPRSLMAAGLGLSGVGSLLVLLCDKIWSVMPAFAVQGFGIMLCLSAAAAVFQHHYATTRLPRRVFLVFLASGLLLSPLAALNCAGIVGPAGLVVGNISLLRQHKVINGTLQFSRSVRSVVNDSVRNGGTNAVTSSQLTTVLAASLTLKTSPATTAPPTRQPQTPKSNSPIFAYRQPRDQSAKVVEGSQPRGNVNEQQSNSSISMSGDALVISTQSAPSTSSTAKPQLQPQPSMSKKPITDSTHLRQSSNVADGSQPGANVKVSNENQRINYMHTNQLAGGDKKDQNLPAAAKPALSASVASSNSSTTASPKTTLVTANFTVERPIKADANNSTIGTTGSIVFQSTKPSSVLVTSPDVAQNEAANSKATTAHKPKIAIKSTVGGGKPTVATSIPLNISKANARISNTNKVNGEVAVNNSVSTFQTTTSHAQSRSTASTEHSVESVTIKSNIRSSTINPSISSISTTTKTAVKTNGTLKEAIKILTSSSKVTTTMIHSTSSAKTNIVSSTPPQPPTRATSAPSVITTTVRITSPISTSASTVSHFATEATTVDKPLMSAALAYWSGLSSLQTLYVLLGCIAAAATVPLALCACCCQAYQFPASQPAPGTVSMGAEHVFMRVCLFTSGFCLHGLEVTLGGYLFGYSVRYLNLTVRSGLLVTGLLYLGIFLSRLLALCYCRCLRAPLFQLGVSAALLTAGVVLFWPAGYTWLWAAALLSGAGLSLFLPTMSDMCERLLSAADFRCASVFLICGQLTGEMLVPVLTGYMHRATSSPSALVRVTSPLLLVALCSVAALYALAKTRFSTRYHALGGGGGSRVSMNVNEIHENGVCDNDSDDGSNVEFDVTEMLRSRSGVRSASKRFEFN